MLRSHSSEILSCCYLTCMCFFPLQTPLTEAEAKKREVDVSLMSLQDVIDSASSKLVSASSNLQVFVV